MPNQPGYTLTPKSAAAIVGMHPDTIRRWADAGRLPFITTPTGHRRFRRSDVERLISGVQ